MLLRQEEHGPGHRRRSAGSLGEGVHAAFSSELHAVSGHRGLLALRRPDARAAAHAVVFHAQPWLHGARVPCGGIPGLIRWVFPEELDEVGEPARPMDRVDDSLGWGTTRGTGSAHPAGSADRVGSNLHHEVSIPARCDTTLQTSAYVALLKPLDRFVGSDGEGDAPVLRPVCARLLDDVTACLWLLAV